MPPWSARARAASIAARTRPLEVRFWSKVRRIRSTSCWLWIGARDDKGYGRIGRGTRTEGTAQAHVVSWEIHNGPVPDGKELLHTCPDGDNPSCVNPAHLRVGTNAENRQDYAERSPKHRGETHELAKLTEADVRYIRSIQTIGHGYWRTKTGVTYQQLADQFGVSEATIRDAAKGRTWKHIT